MNIRRYSNLVSVLSILLPLQFLIGMWLNLFVDIPSPFVIGFLASAGGAVLVLHVLNGLTIATLAVMAVFVSRTLNKAATFRLTVLSMLFVFITIGSGITFVFFGQNDAVSYSMAIGFVFSVVLIAFAGRTLMPVGQSS